MVSTKHFSLSILVLFSASVCLTRAAERGGRRISDGGDVEFKSPCGAANQVAAKVAVCMDEVIDLIYGKINQPKGDQDMVGHCDRFSRTEKCARQVAKDCLSGLHKTSVSAVASATKRFRQQECKSAESRAKYLEPLKCAIIKGPEMIGVFNNHTGIMQGIRDLDEAPEQKLMKMCCVLNGLDRELETRFDRTCPKSTRAVLQIVHAMTDDARNTLCVAPKCKGALDKVLTHKYKPSQNLFETIMEILFQLTVN